MKKVLGDVMVSHGLINDKDGELAKVMFELGHIETYLTRKAVNAKGMLFYSYLISGIESNKRLI